MKEDNIDAIIREALATREIKPSKSSWDRIAVQLEEKKKVKVARTKQKYYAVASVILLMGLTICFYSLRHKRIPAQIVENIIINKDSSIIKTEEKTKIEQNKSKKIQSIPIKKSLDKTILKTTTQKARTSSVTKENLAVSATISNIEVVPIKMDSINKKTTINVDPKALLFAVTHDTEAVKAYYAAHKLNREVLMDSIQVALDKANLTISPELILAAVENDILQEKLEENFMHTVKLKISDIAIAIAERNK